MLPERFRQIRNLFEAALEKQPADRAAYLREAAQSDEELQAEVQRMLDAHERTVVFLDGSLTAPLELRTDPGRMEGRRLGPYEILREIGRGGMGTVYLARRADGLFAQQVAIKVVTPDTAAGEIIRRFHQEREILASLYHPNIARIYDGGSTEEGWPYFIMEYVDGQPIDVWCDQRKLNVSERVRLFENVCAAVQYAHQHRVIHRDLKPGNILVTAEGTVRLLDFGIAKLVRADADQRTELVTRTGIRLMTPEYASPEQMRAEETTPLTDLYSLGVILYELVTGRRPYRLTSRIFHEVVRVVCEQQPTLPSTAATEMDTRSGDDGKPVTVAPSQLSQAREGTPSDLRRRLSGDLDSIIMKSLEKDPRRRYRSVEQFKTDLERHLSGQPILAQQSGRFSVLARAAGRHGATIAIGLSLVAALVAGGIQVNWGGVAWVAGACLLLALWHVATDRELGPKIAAKIYRSGNEHHFHHLAVVMMCMLGLRIHNTLPLWTLAILTICLLNTISLMVAWRLRQQWAGSLVASFPSAERWPRWGFLLQMLQFGIGLYRTSIPFRFHGVLDRLSWADDILGVLTAGALFVCHSVVAQRIEVRDRGIVNNGRLVSWLDIESYKWETSKRYYEHEADVLRLQVTRRFTFLPVGGIKIHEGKEELEAILKRHLSPWPK